MNPNYVRIFDTSLRDGEQSPGASLTSAEKLEIARALARMGVDVIEAGFPAASPDDLEGVRRIALGVGRGREMVAYARSLCPDVEFSPEDAGRSEPEFLYSVLGEAIQSGATTLNIPDTVGYTTPDEFGRLVDGIMKHTPG